MTSAVGSIPVRRFLGVEIHSATMPQAIEVCERAIQSRERLLIGVVNAAKIVNMRRQESLNEAVGTADLVVADGMAVVWASRILRQPLPERVAGIDLFEQLLALADRRGHRVYLLGATREVLDGVLAHVRTAYPRAVIAGARDGYFSDAQAEEVATEIGAAGPDLLFVAMTSPKKEIFLARYADTMRVCVCHGVGGSFDVMAGKVRRAPALWQRLGLEWLYRVKQEPRRLWKRYAVTNTIFIWMVLSELCAAPFRRAKTHEART